MRPMVQDPRFRRFVSEMRRKWSSCQHGPHWREQRHQRQQWYGDRRHNEHRREDQRSSSSSSSIPDTVPHMTAEHRKILESLPRESSLRRAICAEDYYSLLGVSTSATKFAIKQSFNRLAHELHPDKNPSPLAREAFVRLCAAHETLSCPHKRKRYNSTK